MEGLFWNLVFVAWGHRVNLVLTQLRVFGMHFLSIPWKFGLELYHFNPGPW